MELILTLENETSLPNGAPVSVRLSDGDSLDIGRSAQLDWSLPDDSRFISGKHCEVRYRDGAFWLYDVSTNGTFVNEEPERMRPDAAHRLRHGDRIVVGPYVIVVTVEGEEAESPAAEGPQETSTTNPVVVTEVAVRSQDSVFDRELERQASAGESAATAPVTPIVPVIPVADEPPRGAPRPAVFRPGRRAPGPLTVPFEDDDPVPVWANLTGGNASVSEQAAEAPVVAAVAPVPQQPPTAPASASAPAAVKMPAAAASAPATASTPAAASAPAAASTPAHASAPAPASAPALASTPASLPRVGVFQNVPFDTPAAAKADTGTAGAEAVDVATPRRAQVDRLAAATPPRSAESAGRDEAASAAAFISRFAKGAGVPEQIFARRDPLEVAEELGVLMHLVADNLKQLLSARHEAKRFTRAGNQTMIQALDNNPLKFAPNIEDALKIMLGPRTRSYLDARRTLETAFQDLKTHQINTFSAMQGAVKMLVEDLDPQEIEASVGTEDSGLSGWLGNRKNRLWDVFLSRWQTKTMQHSDGIVGAFMLYFADCYDRADE